MLELEDMVEKTLSHMLQLNRRTYELSKVTKF
jgi:hypothetical protein